MTRETQAKIATVAVLAVALGVVAFRKTGVGGLIPNVTRTTDATPQDTIYSMLDAARIGDVEKYLASYTGQMAESLRQSSAESKDFSGYLRESNSELRGIAVMEPEQLSSNEVKTRVEYVFQDRNEVQLFFLEKSPTGWRISRVETAERIKTTIPYGTPVR